jgi:hypothetical protein
MLLIERNTNNLVLLQLKYGELWLLCSIRSAKLAEMPIVSVRQEMTFERFCNTGGYGRIPMDEDGSL